MIQTIRRRQIGRQWAKLTCGLLGVLLASGLAGGLPASLAQATQPGEVTLTVSQVFTFSAASQGVNSVFDYRLAPTAEDNPMPQTSDPGGFTFTIDGTADVPVGPLTFTRPGIYTYELTNTTPPRDGYAVDDEVYTLSIYVEADLTTTIGVVALKRDNTKAMELLFEHSYITDNPDVVPSPSPSVGPGPTGQPNGPPGTNGQANANPGANGLESTAGNLPFTGADVLVLALAALVTLLAGWLALLARRNRRDEPQESI
ncbi:MAG: hypothetical protein FWD29_06420 [Micrococcales bacterium]|nr:hypothetical protein [Micrococcales bacterium]